jgi:hypothetical protein
MALEGQAHAGIVDASSVRVIDISVGGVLLASGRPATVGTRGRLAADVEIRRVSASPDRSGFRIGAMFVGITPAQQDTIQRFARP